MSNRVRKPIHSKNSSDRRLASGARPEAFLLSSKAVASTTSTTKGNAGNADNDDWDPKHFRLFVGNLGSDASDSVLRAAFAAYPSVRKVRVPVDKHGANKGYGFVAFEDASDYLRAFKELNGKYIGHNPCVLKKANELGSRGGQRGQRKRR